MPVPTKGYVIVANRTKFYYVSACNLIESIQDFDPEAKCTLVTEEHFIDDRGREVADQIILCDDHKRAKILGMAKSPYDLTFYIDADAECEHEDITTVFDLFEGNDIMFTSLPEDRSYCYAELKFPGGQFWYCGGVCLYDMRNPLVRDFMQDWYELTVEQYAGRWWPTKEGTDDWDEDLYPRSLARWDQFSLWWLINKEPKYAELKHGVLDDDARWNWFSKYKFKHNEKPIVIRHYSSAGAKKADY